MSEHHSHPPHLTLVQGGLSRRFQLAGVALALLPIETEEPPVDMVVLEEDTHLILNAPNTLRDPGKPLEELVEEMVRVQPHRLGTLLVRRGLPIQVRAVVYDVESDPITRPETLAATLAQLLALFEQERVRRVSLPLLGQRCGQIDLAGSIRTLGRMLVHHQPRQLSQLFLRAPAAHLGKILALLEQLPSEP